MSSSLNPSSGGEGSGPENVASHQDQDDSVPTESQILPVWKGALRYADSNISMEGSVSCNTVEQTCNIEFRIYDPSVATMDDGSSIHTLFPIVSIAYKPSIPQSDPREDTGSGCSDFCFPATAGSILNYARSFTSSIPTNSEYSAIPADEGGPHAPPTFDQAVKMVRKAMEGITTTGEDRLSEAHIQLQESITRVNNALTTTREGITRSVRLYLAKRAVKLALDAFIKGSMRMDDREEWLMEPPVVIPAIVIVPVDQDQDTNLE
ncbi:hypothetical protein BCR39DRAFT_506579 [Naematelia encephala]|uniref:Uncharacterized protein n=1 Tax=Naematelia encephala TaxID=71784 RepID=A0A1Y2AW53_9TREE|nr:hypothetical protein BCR39DRAFT_506579 [Naematelia encephala]